MRTHRSHPPRAHRRGSAILLSLVTVVVLAGMSVVALSVGLATKAENDLSVARQRALYAAEAAVGDAIAKITGKSASITIGDATKATKFADGKYWGTVVDNGDGTRTIRAVGQSGLARRALEVVVATQSGGIYDNAIFAGNAGGDPLYTLKFGGKAKQADVVVGDIYSGGAISFAGTSTVNGVARATGKITTLVGSIIADKGQTPAKPESGITQPIPDIPGMKYETNHDVDVALEFKAAKLASSGAGGKAYQLPESSPAHIFRKHPDNRKSSWSTTTKEDYFLEDPYETMHADTNENGSDATHITLSGPKQKTPGPSGNQKVYYIDGNLWLHNGSTHSFKFYFPDSEGLQVTFVVKGNIYIADNLFLLNKNKDGVAFIAMKDDKVKDSGNVYFGDPAYGTLKQMEAFLYAENNFYDNNLSATGSAAVTLIGNMTAGNQVAINRDFGTQHSKLTVQFDTRIRDKTLVVPGLPKRATAGAGVVVTLWREIGVPR